MTCVMHAGEAELASHLGMAWDGIVRELSLDGMGERELLVEARWRGSCHARDPEAVAPAETLLQQM